ncbi:MAG: hypothetical protein GXY58_19525 [Planctomycetaceae bacterium]|nr:hypothetical protein [Planctomycetaceae bacterium]
MLIQDTTAATSCSPACCSDERWQPNQPRGEVYSRELTEADWKSFSDVQADLAGDASGA